jgi:glutaminyl-tRNA synthetase
MSHDDTSAAAAPVDFIRQIVARDIETGKFDGRVVTRFPPEPNFHLLLGHAKAINASFSIAEEFGGTFHLRFDDTNPSKEERAFVESMKADILWLGFDWGDRLFFASDYFPQLYDFAVQLVRDGKAYVCDLSPEQTREYRGTLTEPGRNSPFRERSVEENLDLLARMRAGEFDDGERVLRAKIDMASPIISLRDPVLYRIQKVSHHRTGDAWCIYPMYDFTHCISDSIEGITHSLCSLEFENQRPLYDWILDSLDIYHPQQIEFARIVVGYMLDGKRKMKALIDEGHVDSYDDPRLWTVAGMRRRGYTPRSIRNFCKRVGMAKRQNVVELAALEHAVREDLNQVAPRVMAVTDPLRLVIDNYPEGQVEQMEAINNPEDSSMGVRQVPFSKVLYIERSDFLQDAPRKFFRLSPGREVRLRYAYLVTCTSATLDDSGEVVEVHCTYDPETRGGDAPDGRRVRGTIHWVSAEHAVDAEVRNFEPLFTESDPEKGGDFRANLNPDSRRVLRGCKVEPSLASAASGSRYQFERQGYFCVDSADSAPGALVFNRTVALRDSWAKIVKKSGG